MTICAALGEPHCVEPEKPRIPGWLPAAHEPARHKSYACLLNRTLAGSSATS